MKNLKQFIGFIFEVYSFVASGFFAGRGNIPIALIFLAIGFALAIWTGLRIKEDSREGYTYVHR